MIDIKIPTIGESISEVTLVKWLKKNGDWVERDELICELESEKASFEINAEKAGVLQTLAKDGDTLKIGDLAGKIDTDAARPAGLESEKSSKESQALTKEPQKPLKEPESVQPAKTAEKKHALTSVQQPRLAEDAKASPVAANILADRKIKSSDIKGSGSQGRIMKNDVFAALEHPGTGIEKPLFSREERREKMSNLRKTVSRRLVEAKNGTAMLTTFNEVDMTKIMDLRKAYKESFMAAHGVNLGFMSFFTKACCFALQQWPIVNAYMDGEELVYHEYCDISIAVSAPKGLVVPVIRNAESLGMADIEKKVAELASKARDNKLTVEEMTGGTFTLTNGGIFGSLMSTPIINIPQSAILGMHKIQERPIAQHGQVVIRSMMYVALSYDHRVIDGRESVSFLVRVKEMLENPEQLLFGQDPVRALLQV